MAWLHNLAGRAEDLLNKIDKNAATVLNESNSKAPEIEINVETTTSSETEEIKENNTSINLLSHNSSFHSSPVKGQTDDTGNDSDGGIIFNVVSEKQRTPNDSIYDESIIEKSLKNSAKSDKTSSASSMHNSFISAEESQILNEKLAKLDFENQDLNKQLLNMQHLCSELKNENGNLQTQVERANEQVAEAQIEKEQYIARAQRILQEKERFISLKQEGTLNGDTENMYTTYNEELKKELEFQQMKNEELNQKNNNLLKEIQSLQIQHQVIQNDLHSTNHTLEQNLMKEKSIRNIAEEDCAQKNKELFLKNQENSYLQQIVQERVHEIKQLQEALKQKLNPNFNEDIETRINSLTQTLMLKQNNLETITTERNALRLQLEKIENEYRSNLAQLNRSQVKVVSLEERDDTIPVPKFMRVSPFDAGVTRRVKRAYSTLDAVSIRTGIFLRRYPVARVFVFCYMVLLHIWVLIILFIYAPSNR